MTCIVSAHGRNGKLAGTGIIVAQDLVLTCAHVVNVALGRPVEEQTRPAAGSELELRFAGAPSAVLRATLDAGVDAWSGPPANRAQGADLCLLNLRGTLPDGASVGLVNPVRFDAEFDVRASGYPADWNDRTSAPQLDVAIAKVLAVDGYLWLLRADPGTRLAITGSQRAAGQVYTGFSGGPVQVRTGIVALVAQARTQVTEATAYAIPAYHFPSRILPPSRPDPAGPGKPGASESLGIELLLEGDIDITVRVQLLVKVPPGPAVDPFEVKLSIRRAFATATDPVHAAAIAAEANDLVLRTLEQRPKNIYSYVLAPASLPNPEKVGLLNYWSAVFDQACLLGPRMLGALLLVAPPAVKAGAKSDIVELYKTLEAWT